MKKKSKKKNTNHLFQESVAIFGKLNITSATNEPESKKQNINGNDNKKKTKWKKIEEIERHFDSSFGTEVGFKDILQTLGGIDGHVKCRRFVQHFGVRVQHSQRHFRENKKQQQKWNECFQLERK